MVRGAGRGSLAPRPEWTVATSSGGRVWEDQQGVTHGNLVGTEIAIPCYTSINNIGPTPFSYAKCMLVQNKKYGSPNFDILRRSAWTVSMVRA